MTDAARADWISYAATLVLFLVCVEAIVSLRRANRAQRALRKIVEESRR